MEEFKERQREMWGAGDYAPLSDLISGMGEHLVTAVGVEPGMRVLDVACGTGNAARPAARAGAQVTGLDLVPGLLDGGRRKAAAEGLEIEWVEGDAEALPFADAHFDRVLSTVGHMFAPRHRETADEMVRVAAPGGVVAFCCWTPEGTVGDVFRVVSKYMPPPPDFASSPILWGTREYVQEMFPTASRCEFEEGSATIEWGSVEGFADYFLPRFGPMVTAARMLGDRFGDLRTELLELWHRVNASSDGRFVLPQEYLLSVVRL